MTHNYSTRPPRQTLAVADLGPWSGMLIGVFLLLMLAAKFASPGPAVQLPFTSTISCLRESHTLTISIDAQNRVYLQADTDELQTALIRQVASRRGIVFGAAQLQELRKMPFLSQDIEQLPAWLSADYYQRRKFAAGIPVEPGNDQLSAYVAASSALSHKLYGRPLYYAIRADRRLAAAQVKHLLKLLQRQGIQRFNLITNSAPH